MALYLSLLLLYSLQALFLVLPPSLFAHPPGPVPQPAGPVPAPLQTAPSTSLLASQSLVPPSGLPGSGAPEVLPYFPSGPPPPDPGLTLSLLHQSHLMSTW